ncbi:unnamed protein product [Rotaria magnacalcarata]|uniref:Uncharacterized protein n=3 Tax=Rotaria magnacalcarata TaxID=392030 RepID=A0A815T968_9BILA|nr:unnamed protein product [Rotaria magnacalcarata]CAF1499994.1 unnamed protein product [Rotaria magnacalcarata]CAF2041988.1 unnamed protein product [Rotaria magnacalcarata]CAF2071691.1 unnamed protein product [Rotaria magnacalcarata]CAF2111210.1 unnamed protein product [Rotaria magnacalcarata]
MYLFIRLFTYSESPMNYYLTGIISFISCLSGAILFLSIIPILLISLKPNMPTTTTSSSFSTEFTMTYALNDIESDAMPTTAEHMAMIFKKFQTQAHALVRDGLVIFAIKKVNTTTEHGHLKHSITCNRFNERAEIIFILSIRLRYRNTFTCQTPICAKSLFTIIHGKLKAISTFTVKLHNELTIQLSLCSIENLVCQFLSVDDVSTDDLK